MPVATLTSKGQVTIPKSIRDFLRVGAGSKVTFELLPNGDVALRPLGAWPARRSAFARVRGGATVKMRTDEIIRLTRGDR